MLYLPRGYVTKRDTLKTIPIEEQAFMIMCFRTGMADKMTFWVVYWSRLSPPDYSRILRLISAGYPVWRSKGFALWTFTWRVKDECPPACSFWTPLPGPRTKTQLLIEEILFSESTLCWSDFLRTELYLPQTFLFESILMVGQWIRGGALGTTFWRLLLWSGAYQLLDVVLFLCSTDGGPRDRKSACRERG